MVVLSCIEVVVGVLTTFRNTALLGSNSFPNEKLVLFKVYLLIGMHLATFTFHIRAVTISKIAIPETYILVKRVKN